MLQVGNIKMYQIYVRHKKIRMKKKKSEKQQLVMQADCLKTTMKVKENRMKCLMSKEKYCIFRTIRGTPPQIWEENGGASHSPNVAYLARGVGQQRWSGFFPIFLL